MNEWLHNYWWIFAIASAYFAGMATPISWRLYQDIKEARQRSHEERLLEHGPDYDEDRDVERITGGWDLPRPVSPGSVTVIAPSPLLKEPSGGYATVGVAIPRPSVHDRYATLQWLDAPRVIARGKARVLATGEGKHRVENVYTSEISLEAIMERIEMENEWQRSSTGQLALSARSSEMEPSFR